MANKKNKKVELIAPAGSWECLNAAIKAGADSVYFGIEEMNMRARSAKNFSLSEINKIASLCHKNNVKCYLALNILLYDKDIGRMKKICDASKKAKIDAVIATDITAIEYARSIGLNVHISTQANVSNFEAVKFYSRYSDMVVLARELGLDEITSIIKRIEKEKVKGPSGELVKVEIFAHGALCVSIAGKCHMSLSTYNHSANRGDCLQPCRRSYRVIDEETGDELIIDNKFVMSPKDLCTIGFIDKILDSGVKALKIEGRGRSEDYVYTVVKAYGEAINSYYTRDYTKEKINEWTKQLESVFNRGFWHGGYYLGNKLGEWSGTFGSKATKKKEFVGLVQNYYPKKNVASVLMQSSGIKCSDELAITGPTTGIVNFSVNEMYVNDKILKKSSKGDLITIKVPEKVRKNDKVYVLAGGRN